MKPASPGFWNADNGGAVAEWVLLVLSVTTISFYTSLPTRMGLERYALQAVNHLLGIDASFVAR